MSDDIQRRMSAALKRAQFKAKAARAKDELHEKSQGRSKAREVVLRAIEKWTGAEIESNGDLPVIRNGTLIGHISQIDKFGRDRIESILVCAWFENTSTLKARLSRYEILERKICEAVESIVELDAWDIACISNWKYPEGASKDEKIIFSLDYVPTFISCSYHILKGIRDEKNSVKSKIENRKMSGGRHRIEARYGVALEFAKLFAKITGEKPTFSKGSDGLSGKFTPALRDLFDAIGWKKAGLKGPAKAAGKSITAYDLSPTSQGLLGWALD